MSTTDAVAGTGVPVDATLRLGLGPVPTFDPAASSPESPSSSIPVDLVFDGLTDLPASGDGAGAVPALAESWTSDDGGRTWRFTLADGTTFSDGSPLTADDVVRSLERARAGDSLVAQRLERVVSIAAVDAATIEVASSAPFASLPELLAAPAYGIVPPGDPITGEIASGPFRVTPNEGGTVRLARVGDEPAAYAAIELRTFDDLGDAVDALDAGELDWTLVPPDRAAEVVLDHGRDGFVPFDAELYLGFNLGDPALADVRLRRAVAAALDPASAVAEAYGSAVAPLAGLVPAGLPGDAGCASVPDETPCAEALEAAGVGAGTAAAQALLAEAYPSGDVPEVVLDHDDGPEATALADALVAQLAAAGIPASARSHAAADYGSFVASGQGGVLSLGWVGVGATADDHLAPWRSGSPDNVTGFADAAVDAFLDEAAATLDPTARAAVLTRAEAAVLAAVPAIPLAQFQLLSAAASDAVQVTVEVDGTLTLGGGAAR